ncbi:MAG TPA: hypothetical protein VKT28_19670 [Puia sp.]|nr:hypothetical protein [Puia sp.]
MDKKKKSEEENSKPKIYGDPEYDASEDIYNKGEKAGSIDGDDNPKLEKKKTKNKLGDNDLDVPGSELDDADEAIGEEDEENNYYSLGGDDHDDLEEDKGE